MTTIIGIDCAVQATNLGLACGRVQGTTVRIEEALPGRNIVGAVLKPAPTESALSLRERQMSNIAATVSAWIAHDAPTLIALDAPLGWPKPLGEVLSSHEAAEPVAVTADAMFRRQTDAVVKSLTDKQPLDVGADRIARTAHAALDLLDRLGGMIGQDIPLAWEPFTDNSVHAIEVYPAGTLAVLLGGPENARGYKGTEGREARRAILDRLQEELYIPPDLIPSARKSDDVLDAIVCVLAGADFLREQALPPTAAQRKLAEKEGWIWVRRPRQGQA